MPESIRPDSYVITSQLSDKYYIMRNSREDRSLRPKPIMTLPEEPSDPVRGSRFFMRIYSH